MTCHYFLRTDFEALQAQIESIRNHIVLTGQDMGAACCEGAETFHDNFAHEDGERQQRMWTRRLRELIRIRDHSRVIEPAAGSGRVKIGSTVSVLDLDSGETKTFRIGSFMTFNGSGTVSYASPLGKLLVGAAVGDIREGEVAGKERVYEVLDVH